MDVAEWFLNSPVLMLFCFASVALATNDDKLDHIVKKVDEISSTLKGHNVRITRLEEDKIRRDERAKYEQDVEDVRVYRFIAQNTVKIIVAIITAVLIAWVVLQLGPK